MTEGTPWKKLLLYSFPLLLGNIAQQLYSTVDSIVVGQFVGDNALKAIGSSLPIVNMIALFFVMIGTGSSVMVSQYYGAKDKEKLSQTIGTSITWTVILGLVLLLFGQLLVEPLLNVTNTPAEYYQWSKDYLVIFLLGIHGLAFYNIFAGILRGLGDSMSALIFVLVATGLNIVLDLYLVINLNMGVRGVAIATVISQFVSAILTFLKLRSYKEIKLELRHLIPHKHNSLTLFKLGIPSGITQGIFSLAILFVQRLTNLINIADINTMVMRVDGFAMLPVFTFGIAMTTYTGQNIGARKMDRLSEGTKQGLRLSLITTVILVALIVIFGKNLMALFTKTQENIDLAYNMMLVLTLGYIAMAVTQALMGVMRGAGDTMTPMWIVIFNNTIVRVPLAYLIAYLSKSPEWPHGHPIATFGSLVITWVLGAILTTIFFKRGRWRTKAIVDVRDEVVKEIL